MLLTNSFLVFEIVLQFDIIIERAIAGRQDIPNIMMWEDFQICQICKEFSVSGFQLRDDFKVNNFHVKS